MPARVPIPLDIPIKILAYRGAMSRWFTLNPVNRENKSIHVQYLNVSTNFPSHVLDVAGRILIKNFSTKCAIFRKHLWSSFVIKFIER